MSDSDEFLVEFLEECEENLDLLERELVALEDAPTDAKRLQSIFRTIHTIKGSSGFFGFSKLGALTHGGETLLGLIRDGELRFNQPRASALLQMSDAVREITVQIELTGTEGTGDYSAITDLLDQLTLKEESDDAEASEPTPASEPKPLSEPVEELAASQPAEHPIEESATTAAPPLEQAPSYTPPESHTQPEQGTVISSDESQPKDPPKGTQSAPAVPESSSIRVDVELLDELMDLAGELVLARNEFSQNATIAENHELSGIASHLSQVTSSIQDRVMRTRMQPIEGVFSKFKRTVRDLAIDCGKQIRLELEGGETELDRTLLDAIRDPLTHIVRNSVDHGIETPEQRLEAGKPAEGLLRLRASHQSGQVVIEAIDDGGGINVARVREKAIAKGLITHQEAMQKSDGAILQYIFSPGFSTASQVSALSGRGVGMDVVRSHIQRIGGSVDLISELHQGTTIKITIPLTLAIVPSLTVRAGHQRFVLPQASLQEVILANSVEAAQNVPVIRLRERLLPLIWLDELLELGTTEFRNFSSPQPLDHTFQVLILQAEGKQFGLVVDEVQNAQEVVVKPISNAVKSTNVYSAATLLGDGSIALILDISGIGRQSGLLGRSGEEAAIQIAPALANEQIDAKNEPSEPLHAWLICDVGSDREVAIALDSVQRIDELRSSDIETSEAGRFASYRGGVLPLVSFAESSDSTNPEDHEMVSVIVHQRNGISVGATVDRVIDIVESHHGITQSDDSHSSSVVGLTVASGRPIEVVDLSRL